MEIIKGYESHPKVAIVDINEENSGSPFKQLSKDITLAKGKYIWIAESDDFCEEDFLSTFIESHHKNPWIALVHCQFYRVNFKGEIKGTWIDHANDLVPKVTGFCFGC